MREIIILMCQKCKSKNYTTKKNKTTTPKKIERKKYCKFCKTHTVHKETK